MRTPRTITASLAAILGAAALAGPAAADSHQQPDSWYAGKSTIEGSTRTDQHSANDSAKANVYVPPTAAFSDTVAPAEGSAKANVYVPPEPQPIQRLAPAASASSSGFDRASAGIGAAVAMGAFLIAFGGAAGLRRRRQIQPATTG
jgi:hypothetical protein